MTQVVVAGRQGLWQRLAEPSPLVVDPADRRTARLLSRLLLLIAPLGLLSAVLQFAEDGEVGLVHVAVSLAVVALLAAYWLSRTRHFAIAAIITTLTPTLGGLAVLAGESMDPGWFAFMALNPALGTLLLRNRDAILLAALNVVAVVVAVIIADDLVDGMAIVAVSFNVIISVVLLTAKHHRNNLERDRNEALIARQRLNESILKATFGGIAQHDGAHISDANNVFRRLFGIPPSGAVETPLYELFAVEARADLEEALNAGAGRLLEVEAVRGDGSRFTAEVLAARIDEGDARSNVLAVRDVTERKEATDSLLRAQRMESVGRLAAGIAHDTNNQLSVISANAELLMRDQPDEVGATDRARIIRDATDQMGTLLRRVLAVGGAESSNEVIIDVESTISDLVPMWQRVLPRDVRVDIVRDGGGGRIVMDPTDFEQVCLNLVLNAADAMDGRGHLRIELGRVTINGDEPPDVVSDLPVGEYQQVLVVDTGEGIPAEHLDRIFQPFFTTKDATRGTGLGLYTARKLVEDAGGTLTATSHSGGSTFRVLLPEVAAEVPVD